MPQKRYLLQDLPKAIHQAAAASGQCHSSDGRFEGLASLLWTLPDNQEDTRHLAYEIASRAIAIGKAARRDLRFAHLQVAEAAYLLAVVWIDVLTFGRADLPRETVHLFQRSQSLLTECDADIAKDNQ